MRPLILFAMVVAGLWAHAATPIPLQDAVKNGLVKVTVKGEGGHTGKVLTLEVTNNERKYITVDIPTGLQFQSVDTNTQDLIITDGAQLVLGAAATRKITLHAMCIKPGKGSPSLGSAFLLGTMAADTLLKLVQFIDEQKYQDGLGQSAVWTIIRNEGLENVYGDNPERLKTMLLFMHKLTGKPLPWYNIEKPAPPPGRVFTQEPSILHGVYNFTLTEKGFAKLAVYNEAGEQVFLFQEKMEVFAGENRIKFKLEVKGYKKGKYYARLHIDGVLKEEKVFEI